MVHKDKAHSLIHSNYVLPVVFIPIAGSSRGSDSTKSCHKSTFNSIVPDITVDCVKMEKREDEEFP